MSKTELLKQTWRPAMMFLFMAIIANNYFIMPYIGLIFNKTIPTLTLPNYMWEIIKLGMGTYVVGRSVEKTVNLWKGRDQNG